MKLEPHISFKLGVQYICSVPRKSSPVASLLGGLNMDRLPMRYLVVNR